MAAWKRGQCFQEHSPVWLLLGNCLGIPAVFAKDLVKLLSGSFQSSLTVTARRLKSSGDPAADKCLDRRGSRSHWKQWDQKSSIKATERDQSPAGRTSLWVQTPTETRIRKLACHCCQRWFYSWMSPWKWKHQEGSRAGADALQCDLKTASGKCLKYLPEDSSQQSWLRSSQTLLTRLYLTQWRNRVRRPLPPWHLTYLTKSIVLLLTESFCTKLSRNH